GSGSLRAALAGNDPDIVFNSGLNGTITLVNTSGPLIINNTNANNWTITANPTVNSITISGLYFSNYSGDLIVANNTTATISGLTFTNGKDTTNAFGAVTIGSAASLTVNGCTFVNNEAPGAGGGAIVNTGSFTATNCTFYNNRGVDGGAIL